MTTEPTGPANTAEDPLGPSTPQPEPTGDPRRPGRTAATAENIRDAQGTSPGGTVPAGHSADSAESADSDGPGADDGGGGTAPERALDETESADG